ncbi:MAG: tetratricopeptide repeat protein [Elusimicrobiota bacterium]
MKKVFENLSRTCFGNKWFAVALIILVSIGIYHKSLNAPFIFDDIGKIVENPDIKKLSNLKAKLIYPYTNNKIWERNDPSRPITYLTFTLNYYFGKLNTFGYHLFNLVVHIFNAILIFILTRKILLFFPQSPNFPISQFLIFPFFVALFFTVHPINISSVLYIFSRSVLLATFFYLMALLLFIKATEKNSLISLSPISYLLSLICFILALFSRQDVVTLPIMILLVDYIFLSDFNTKKVIEKKYYHIPFWILLVVYLLFRYFYFGDVGDAEAGTLWDRYPYIIIQPYVVLKYLKMLLIPTGLCIVHKINPARISELKTILALLSITVIFWLTYKIYKKKANNSKITLFSVLWFFITLSPTSSFFPTTSALVENRLYLSGFGFYFIFVFFYTLVSKFFNLSNFLIFLICIHIFLLGYVTVKRNQLYQNPVLLWQDVISRYPNSIEAHNNLGILLYNSNRFEEAEKAYRNAIRINPNFVNAYTNLGNLFKCRRIPRSLLRG